MENNEVNLLGVVKVSQPIPLAPPPLPTPPAQPGVHHCGPPGRLFFCYGMIKHAVWAVLLAGWGPHVRATPVAGLLDVFNGWLPLSCILGLASIVAFYGIRTRPTLTKVICLLPQQMLMTMTFVSGVTAVIAGKYADGTVIPWPHILADQLPAMLAAVFHTIALILLSRRV